MAKVEAYPHCYLWFRSFSCLETLPYGNSPFPDLFLSSHTPCSSLFSPEAAFPITPPVQCPIQPEVLSTSLFLSLVQLLFPYRKLMVSVSSLLSLVPYQTLRLIFSPFSCFRETSFYSSIAPTQGQITGMTPQLVSLPPAPQAPLLRPQEGTKMLSVPSDFSREVRLPPTWRILPGSKSSFRSSFPCLSLVLRPKETRVIFWTLSVSLLGPS